MARDGLGFGLEITELRLGLPGSSSNDKKRVFSEIVEENRLDGHHGDDGEDRGKVVGAPVAKTQVVGWPPVHSHRMKSFDKVRMESAKSICVKVSMDGAIYLRKIDLSMQKGYSGLVVALEKLFGCYGIGEGLKDAESGEHKLIYEDKDGDWMLVGDVPWEMFTESCKRLRIMKKSEAKEIGVIQERDFLKSGGSFADE